MTREEKAQRISYFEDEFKSSAAVVIADYKGLSVKDLETLREASRVKDVKVRVLNNKLATIALKNIGIEGLELNQTNIALWGEDQIAVCKSSVDFAKTNNKLVVKTGIIENEIADISKIEAFAKLPGREELLGMLLSVWTAPARNFVTGLDNLRAKIEEEA